MSGPSDSGERRPVTLPPIPPSPRLFPPKATTGTTYGQCLVPTAVWGAPFILAVVAAAVTGNDDVRDLLYYTPVSLYVTVVGPIFLGAALTWLITRRLRPTSRQLLLIALPMYVIAWFLMASRFTS